MYEVAENRLSPLNPTDQPLDTKDLFTGVDVANMSIEDLEAMGKFVSAVGNAYVMVLDARTKEIITRTKENVARKAIIDAEIVQLREKRVATALPDAAPRRKLPRVEPTLDQNGPLLFQKRWSISHAILRAVCEDVGSECAPPLEDVFALVEKWFANRWKKVGKCNLHFRTVYIRDVPVVYGWGEGHKHAFFYTRHHDQLLQHVKRTMFPSTETTVTNPTPSVNSQTKQPHTD